MKPRVAGAADRTTEFEGLYRLRMRGADLRRRRVVYVLNAYIIIDGGRGKQKTNRDSPRRKRCASLVYGAVSETTPFFLPPAL